MIFNNCSGLFRRYCWFYCICISEYCIPALTGLNLSEKEKKKKSYPCTVEDGFVVTCNIEGTQFVIQLVCLFLTKKWRQLKTKS